MRSLVCAFVLMSGVSAAPASSSAMATTQQTVETATQFYMRWRTTVQAAKSMEEVIPS